jgi:hypothetical protein
VVFCEVVGDFDDDIGGVDVDAFAFGEALDEALDIVVVEVASMFPCPFTALAAAGAGMVV